ncbi:beta-N-acetylglucosaminidase domain-containing protein [Amycolatopsis sp. CA-230715]|uniref:beta-N-acetylglucosaminidase domain-containing protein n=1 Tax=Amycolatopsis sp. CA-230715 TaxID=2745196 RepID=UPI001C010DF5|nr:beta-N-acetylglucosaminidase domain-containing protein [Amycolatopsis sp. CA-230715]QWF79778.1 O-GlcNAcase [Amycolatopsis sp. CA-230715]
MVLSSRFTRLFVTAVTALTVVVAPAASAAPEKAAVPKVWPVPQQVDAGHGALAVPATVGEVFGEHADPAAVAVVEQALRGAGAKRFVPGPAELTVYLGGPATEALDRLGVPGPAGLASGGYVLAADRASRTLALSGADARGTFYAAQTLRQLVTGHRIPEVKVRDWPAMPLRGVIEGFYGAPWSHADRLAQLDFYGRTKQNIYVYSPKDDPYLRARWRDTYPADKLAEIKALVDRGAANHVDFTYALSPGLSICYSDPAETTKLVAKFQSLWDIGVRSFAIPLDDISYTKWNCDADAAKFGTGGAAAGAAQSFLLNAVQKQFIETHPGIDRLQMVPTEYYDLADSGYKTALRTQLDPRVVVEWTGVGVIAPTITTEQAKQTHQVFGHDILVWDNYPVNDYITDRLLMGPYVGREPGIAGELAGVTANPMVQAESSKIAEFTSADFLWNPKAYDPDASWRAALADLGGRAAAPLTVFSENNYAGALDRVPGKPDQDSPVLRPLLDAFWSALDGRGDLLGATWRLDDYLRKLASNPADLRKGMADNPAFLDEIGPWLDKLGLLGDAGRHAVKMLLAQRFGDNAGAWAERRATADLYARAQAIVVQTARGAKQPLPCLSVCTPFLDKALSKVDTAFGVPMRPTATTSGLGTYQDNAPSRMVDRDDGTFYWSDWNPPVGSSVGVDLGAVKPVGHVEIKMGNAKSPNDYVHHGVLEYSADGNSWAQAATTTDQAVVSAGLPAGATARYVRLRVTAAQEFWVVVREFSVGTLDNPPLAVTGGPAGNLAAVADGDASTVYKGASPAPGDVLTVTAASARALDGVTVLASDPAPRAEIQVGSGGQWRTVGFLTGAYTSVRTGGRPADGVRLVWRSGSPVPKVNEIVPRFR